MILNDYGAPLRSTMTMPPIACSYAPGSQKKTLTDCD